MQKIVIAGGGYGGLACLRTLNRELGSFERDILLLDPSSHHAIKSRFHERAVLKSREVGIRFPLKTLASASNARFVQDGILSIDLDAKMLAGRRGEYRYDVLVLAPGGRSSFYNIPGAREHTCPIDTLEAAAHSAERLSALMNERSSAPVRVAVCGAGIEGIEVATQTRQLAGREKLELTLIEGGERVLPAAPFPEERERVERHLAEASINILLGKRIVRVEQNAVHLAGGETVDADLILWCAGIRPVTLDGLGQGPFMVTPYLHHPEHPEVYAAGDFVLVDSDDKFANLASAQRAVYQGAHAARNIAARLIGRPLKKAHYKPVGELVALGDFDGVGVVLGKGVSGLAAAMLKRGNELKYIAELYGDLGRSAALAALWPLRRVFK